MESVQPSNMIGFEGPDDIDREICYTTIGRFPGYIDPRQIPTKKEPFSTVSRQSFIHSAQLILPAEVYHATYGDTANDMPELKYAKVMMPLSALLEDKFFTTYIKVGNILMISDGRPGLDDIFTLRDGVLSLELSKSSYERAGLVGKPVESGGKKHKKNRYLVEINLRLPSMLHGKKGFERIVWAFKNILTYTVTWLFHDLASTSSPQLEAPIHQHQPQFISSTPSVTMLSNALVPPLSVMNFPAEHKASLADHTGELQEWLALLSLNSPRVHSNDSVDPYLSRYHPPDGCSSSNIVQLTWRGLIPNKWITHMLIDVLRQTAAPRTWFALISSPLKTRAVGNNDGYIILGLPKEQDEASLEEKGRSRRKFICWEYTGSKGFY